MGDETGVDAERFEDRNGQPAPIVHHHHHHHHAGHEMEVGATEAVTSRVSPDDRKPIMVTARRLRFEHARPTWIREMAAEAIGVFIFSYPGIASQASFFLNDTQPAFGSIMQIGLAFGFGIASAIMISGPTSGGHLNPAMTICFAIWHGFPWKKVPQYILAQVFGAFMSGVVLMGQYHPQITELAAKTRAAGASLNSSTGPGALLCGFPAPKQTNHWYLFLIEFFADGFLGFIAWLALDPSNPFVSQLSAPFIIGLAWANMIWGFGFATVSYNGSRDLGTRIVAAIFFGGDAFPLYSLISIFTCIPSIFVSTAVYEFFLRDSEACIETGVYAYAGDLKDIEYRGERSRSR
ncbi:hypothetical protein PVAG01_10985 [Phlyctema vagabunda]|uniref:Aquaporin-like protein n=1 Tax=Phlyctema vagabunda TaxID=108571 RepID=A0ABR4P3W4_9HELO